MQEQASEQPEAQERQPRFKSSSLHGADGETMTILASRKAEGAVTAVTVTTRDPKTGRNLNVKGATERHGSFEEAAERVAKLTEEAVALGWRRKEGSGGFKARPDQFAVLPKPGAAAKPAAHAKPAKRK